MPREIRVPASTPRERLAPSRRQRPNINVPQALYDRIANHAASQGVSLQLALSDMLDARAPAVIPWATIREALIVEFGLMVAGRIDSALHSAGMPPE